MTVTVNVTDTNVVEVNVPGPQGPQGPQGPGGSSWAAITGKPTTVSGYGITDFAANVRTAVLTGLSVATSTVVAATDGVLVAVGKLQAQITGLASSKLDANANAVSATKLATARTINGVSFDGTANVTVADTTKEPTIAVGTSFQYWRGDKSWQSFNETVDDRVAALIVGGTNISATYDDAAGTLTIAASGTVSAAASDVTVTPTGGISATNAQAAFAELDTEKEPAITGGTSAQYWRGDKTWRDFATDVRAAVLTGLSTATSTVVAATDTILVAIGKLQAQITLRAPLASPTLTGVPLAPTAGANTNTTQIATTAYVDVGLSGKQPLDTDLTAIAALISAADTVPYATGAGAWALAAFTSVGRTLLAATTQALQRTALGLSAAATASAIASTAWTPVLTFGGLSTGIAGTQVGTYVRIGPLIFWQLRIVLTSKGSSVGAVSIGGLPAAAASDHQRGDFDSYANLASVTSPYGFVSSGGTSVALVQMGAATQANMTDANFTNTSVLVMSGVLNTGSLT